MARDEHMTGESQRGRPVMTEETARRLAREGEELRRAYRRRVESMRKISRDARQIRVR